MSPLVIIGRLNSFLLKTLHLHLPITLKLSVNIRLQDELLTRSIILHFQGLAKKKIVKSKSKIVTSFVF